MSEPRPAPPAPPYGAGTLSEVTPSLAAAVGVAGSRDVLGIGEARAAAVLLVDGLGAELLAAHARDAPTLTELAEPAEPAEHGRSGSGRLRVGFPATTAVSLASLGTGLPPGEHGIVGYSMGVPPLDEPEAAPETVLNTLRWCRHGAGDRVDLLDALPPERVQTAPTVLERASGAGVSVTRVGPEYQRDSGLTRAALRGGHFRAAAALGDLGAGIRDALAADGAGLCYAYHADLDLLGHLYGPGSAPWRMQLGVIDRLVALLAEDLPPDTVLAVVADHGMVATDRDTQVDLDTTPTLLAGVRHVAGEARVRHVHAAPGAAGDVLDAWRAELGDRAWVRAREEAIDDGWFGPRVSDAARGRIGDVVAAATGRWTLVRSRAEPRESVLVGHHGSLTDDEQFVPLIVARGG